MSDTIDAKTLDNAVKNLLIALEKANKAGCYSLNESHQLFIDINNVATFIKKNTGE